MAEEGEEGGGASKQQQEQQQEWTMTEDWELMDQLPKFTVGEGSHCRTFWTQMAACNPILSAKSPNDLLARCQYLEQQQENKHHEKESTSKETSTSRPATSRLSPRSTMQFGPSPPLLSQWSVGDDDNDDWDNKKKNVMVGQLQDGRTIWLHYHCIGRLPGDPLSDASSPSVLQLVPGGFVEAIGGRIYELGEARATTPFSAVSSSQRTGLRSAMEGMTSDVAKTTSTKLSEWKKGDSSLDWLLPPVSASVSAFLACTVLSACIGYGAGLSIIADDHHHASSSAAPGKIHSTTTTTTTSSSSSASTPSLAEQKARAEYRVLREQRMLQRMTERLEQDQKNLMDLQQQQ